MRGQRLRTRERTAGIAALALAMFGTAALAQNVIKAPPATDPATRLGMMRALFVLKIAPYLTVEPPARTDRKSEDKEKDKKEKEKEKEKERDKPAAKAVYRIAFVGIDDVVRAAPSQLADKKVGNADVRLVTLTPEQATDAKRQPDYDLLYVAQGLDLDVIESIVATHAQRAIPLVCARDGFAAMGGGVQVFVQDNTIRFELNHEALRRQGVRVDPQLAKLAKKGPE